MDLSINKLGKNNLIKFQGMKGDFDKKNNPVYKFYPPVYNKGEETAWLELFPLITEDNGKLIVNDKQVENIEFNYNEPIEIDQNLKFKNHDEISNEFAYRYKITNKNTGEVRYLTDDFRKIETPDGKFANIIEKGQNSYITPKIGPMRHSFIDSDVIFNEAEGKIADEDKNFVRNHFNKLGGSIKGLNNLLINTDELEPYRYIMTTPDIGVDTISSHKYWPNNQYQCNNIEDFKEFNFNLYERGKSYIADGAFTSQGLESPMVQHVLKWGEQSPFYNMLKIDSNLGLGILPERLPEDGNNLDYIAVKLINNPQRNDYNEDKPTYIQFFDTRLVKDSTRDAKK